MLARNSNASHVHNRTLPNDPPPTTPKWKSSLASPLRKASLDSLAKPGAKELKTRIAANYQELSAILTTMTPTNMQNRNLIPTTSVSTKLSEPLALPVAITPTKQPIEKPKLANLSIDIKPKIVKKVPLTQQLNSDNNNEPIISYFIMLGDKIEDEQTIMNYRDIDDAEKSKRITKIFTRAASNGDARKIRHMLSQEQLIPFIDIDRQDEDGTTPLIYAACFGALDVLRALLEAGANPNRQDKCKYK
jgi:Ankyrin repeats (3 copies)